MDNQTYYTPQAPTDNRRERIILAAVGLLVLLIMAALLMWLFSNKPREPRNLAETELKQSENFGYLNDTSVFAFNGLAFYKYDLDNNKTTVLNSGTKLPVPDRMFWANDKGVLVSFSHSFAATLVEQTLQAQGKSPYGDDIKNYVWYYSFDKSSLTLVSQAPMVPEAVLYSSERDGFYYVPDLRQMGELEYSEVDVTKASLRFFDIEEGVNQKIVDDLAVIAISKFSECPTTEDLICIVAREESSPRDTKLFAINPKGQKSVLLSASGRMIPTNRKELYITTEQTESNDIEGGSNSSTAAHNEENFEKAPAILNDLSSDSKKRLGIDIGASDIIAHFDSDDSFYVLDSSLYEKNRDYGNTYDYWEGVFSGGRARVSKLGLYVDSSNKKMFESRLGSPMSHGSHGYGLYTSSEGKQVIFGSHQPISLPEPANKQEVIAAIKSCESFIEDSQYLDSTRLARIYFADNQQTKNEMKSFANCILKDKKILFGNNYYFGTVSPVNGRITSD